MLLPVADVIATYAVCLADVTAMVVDVISTHG